MMTDAASGFIPLAYSYSSSGGSGRLNFPVAASQLLYANFQHVAGVAAPSGSGTMSIDSLKILDTLIGRLESIKAQPLQAAEAPRDLTPGRVDALIQQYGSELHAKAQAPARPYVPAVPVETGMLFSFAA